MTRKDGIQDTRCWINHLPLPLLVAAVVGRLTNNIHFLIPATPPTGNLAYYHIYPIPQRRLQESFMEEIMRHVPPILYPVSGILHPESISHKKEQPSRTAL
jgi:hypothetical protein